MNSFRWNLVNNLFVMSTVFLFSKKWLFLLQNCLFGKKVTDWIKLEYMMKTFSAIFCKKKFCEYHKYRRIFFFCTGPPLKKNDCVWWDLIFLVKFHVCQIFFKLHILIHKRRKNNDLVWVTFNWGERKAKHNDDIFYPPKKLDFQRRKISFLEDQKNVIQSDKKSPTKMTDFSKTFCVLSNWAFFQTFFCRHFSERSFWCPPIDIDVH